MQCAQPQFHVVNVVITSELGRTVDLRVLASFPGVRYNKTNYHGIVAYLKTSGMRGSVSIFNTGKMISAGTTSFQEAQKDLHYAFKLLRTYGFYQTKRTDYRVRNIVATVDFGHFIDLTCLALEFQKTLYEPDQFPGAAEAGRSLSALGQAPVRHFDQKEARRRELRSRADKLGVVIVRWCNEIAAVLTGHHYRVTPKTREPPRSGRRRRGDRTRAVIYW